MKVCVFSDSHGYAGNMIAAIGIEKPDVCFFLGDGERDLYDVEEVYPDLPIYSVRGNCDIASQSSATIVCNIGGVDIFATHGHMYNVKHEYEFETLAASAMDVGASLALFGHTHRQNDSDYMGVRLVNPGSVGRSTYACYAVLEIADGWCRSVELKAI